MQSRYTNENADRMENKKKHPEMLFKNHILHFQR